MSFLSQPWFYWALGSAGFAALTAIFAKLGVSGVPSDLATLIRTLVVIPLAAGVAYASGALQSPQNPSGRTWLFLILSGLGTGASWLCYFRALQMGEASKVAPVDKLSVALVALFGVLFLGEQLSLRNWIGAIFVMVGVLLLASRG